MFVLYVCEISAVFVYDRQTLLNLRLSTEDLVDLLDFSGRGTLPPFLTRIPVHLCCVSALPPWWKRFRRGEKCSGKLVRLKACLMGFSSAPWTTLEPCWASLFPNAHWTLSTLVWYPSSAWEQPLCVRLPGQLKPVRRFLLGSAW